MAEAKMQVKIGDLKFNPELIEARPINAFFVSRYRQAYRSGKNMGDIIINKKTMEIVSGNHRVTALLEEYNEDYEIQVVARNFKTKLDELKCFAEENAAHGNALDGKSRKAVTKLMMDAGATQELVANIFGVSTHRIEKWGEQTVFVIQGKRQEPRISKAGVTPGTVMNQEQYKTHWRADRGISVATQAEQLIRWIENGWVKVDDVRSMKALEDLQSVLNAFLGEKRAAA